ncbi:hypothetical protein J6590_042184 [Homalodisca vitripennis]|nr:hypothetical protein J6590_042184 [Homalodisca vitripennis]
MFSSSVTATSLRVPCQSRYKGEPPPAYSDWRGRYRAGFPFFRGDMTFFLMNLDGRQPLPPTLPILSILSLWKQRKDYTKSFEELINEVPTTGLMSMIHPEMVPPLASSIFITTPKLTHKTYNIHDIYVFSAQNETPRPITNKVLKFASEDGIRRCEGKSVPILSSFCLARNSGCGQREPQRASTCTTH